MRGQGADQGTGTLDNPVLVRSAGDEQYAGCTGVPADSHGVIWLGVSRIPPHRLKSIPSPADLPLLQMSKDRPIERCPECGSVYKMNYVGPQDDGHGHGHDHGHGWQEPKTFADYVKPQYY